ncbi:NAD(P)/FAD-dependent oxidoreductase [Rhodococcus sp. NPDC059968]|uniref:NAD(P)/FAD-dependent oxidoreductase n=1 Tax=Rhodococcus sp. NPDC059968 TaxID=3347017 RepID=UPI0036722C93
MSRFQRIVVVGGSLAGMNVIQELRRLGYTGAITLVGEEDVRSPYDRTELSKKLLTGTRDPDDLYLLTTEEIGELDLDLRLGRRATALSLDPSRHTLTLDDGTVLEFDALVVATGSRARRPAFMGDLAGVHVLRTLPDALALRSELDSARDIVVVGAGFIGAEVAASVRTRGQSVTLVDPQPTPLGTVLGPIVGSHFADLHTSHGTNLELGVGVQDLVGDGRVTGVRLTDGRLLPADLVVVGVGGSPVTEWLDGSGVEVDNGVLCDDGGHTNVPGIYAVGDAARWYSDYFGAQVRSEHWNNATLQATVVAENIVAAEKKSTLCAVPSFWSDQYRKRTQMVGCPRPTDEVCFVSGGPGDERFVALYGRDDRVTGVVSFNSPRGLIKYQHLVAEGASWSASTAALENIISTDSGH